jgi:type IV pilus assembly protein PilA
MKPDLKAKFIQHLNHQTTDRGFTLIELLVVIVIIGILAAIAIPNFLAQTAKARQSEAKQNIQLINKAQVNARLTGGGAYRTKFDELAIGTLKGNASTDTTVNFSYGMLVYATADKAVVIATPQDVATKSYGGGILRYVNSASSPVTTSIICESDTPNAAALEPISTTTTIACAPTFVELGREN